MGEFDRRGFLGVLAGVVSLLALGSKSAKLPEVGVERLLAGGPPVVSSVTSPKTSSTTTTTVSASTETVYYSYNGLPLTTSTYNVSGPLSYSIKTV